MPTAPLVIVNPVAGGGRAARLTGWIRERLRPRPDVVVEVTRRAGDAERLAAQAVSAGIDRVIAVGGDGTVQEIVNGLLDGGANADLDPGVVPSVGIVPVGSGNDLARSLGLPREAGAAWGIAIGAGERPIDVGRATNGEGRTRWFTSAGGIGFDAQVAAAMTTRSGWQRGSIGYLVTTLAELRRFSNRRIALTLDGTQAEHQVLFVAIANGAYYGGGMKIAPGARPDDGTLDVCVVGDISRLTALRQLPNLYRGTHVRHPRVSLAQAHTITVDGDAGTLVHLDGEPFGELPLRVELVAGRLTVATPLR